MTGMSYEFDASEALAGTEELKRRIAQSSGFYKNVGDYLTRSTLENFKRETSPDGQPWKPLLPSTIRNRASQGQTPIAILRAQGDLAGSINAQAGSTEVKIGSAVPHAAIHQLGGTIKKPARKGEIFLKRNEKTGEIGNRFVKKSKANAVQDVNIPAHQITIPARPYLGVSDADITAIIEIADEWLHD
jgi:phage virion morphogenesis protein